MIHLDTDTLTFSFRALDAEIHQLIEDHIERTSAAFVANFATEADRLLAKRSSYSDNDDNALAESRSRLDGFSDAQIGHAYRKACLAAHPSDGSHCEISFQRTLRLPDDGKVYPLPAGLGCFPLRSVAAHAESAPAPWLEKGGALLPMYQGEAMWMSFHSSVPCALKIGAGSVNALTGELDLPELDSDPQNYVVIPDQPWLDGFKVSKGTVRQFVAMPLGGGFTASEQLAQNAEAGGVVIEAFPMKAGRYFEDEVRHRLADVLEEVLTDLLGAGWKGESGMLFCRAAAPSMVECCGDMGLGAGGKIQQEVYADDYGIDAWSFEHSSRLCVQTCNAMMWRAVTGENPPHPPLTAKEYARHEIPWFDFYRDDLTPLPTTEKLAGLKSVDQVSVGDGLPTFTTDDEIDPQLVIHYGNARRPEEIREWSRL